MRRPVYDRRFVVRFNQIGALKGAKRRPTLKKNTIARKGARTAFTRREVLDASPKRTIGVDLGDQDSHYCILDRQGDVLSEGVVRNP
jgi:hypothetical protein